jgi:hypothetical protein
MGKRYKQKKIAGQISKALMLSLPLRRKEYVWELGSINTMGALVMTHSDDQD